MRKVRSTRELLPVELHERRDGQSEVYLRKGIVTEEVECDGIAHEEWSADEVLLVGFYTREFAEGNFDSLWNAANASDMTDAQRMADLERQTVDTQVALCEMYEALMGVE